MPHGSTCSRFGNSRPVSFLGSLAQQDPASPRGDWILCQITSKPYADARAIRLEGSDFASGGLELTSYVRPGKLFTANETLMIETVGRLRADKLHMILGVVAALFKGAT
jgi:hypothetical protein